MGLSHHDNRREPGRGDRGPAIVPERFLRAFNAMLTELLPRDLPPIPKSVMVDHQKTLKTVAGNLHRAMGGRSEDTLDVSFPLGFSGQCGENGQVMLMLMSMKDRAGNTYVFGDGCMLDRVLEGTGFTRVLAGNGKFAFVPLINPLDFGRRIDIACKRKDELIARSLASIQITQGEGILEDQLIRRLRALRKELGGQANADIIPSKNGQQTVTVSLQRGKQKREDTLRFDDRFSAFMWSEKKH